MSGAADDESAPSTSTPQSPEGVEGQPDVTVTETKPETPSTPGEESVPPSESQTKQDQQGGETETEQNENTNSANADNKAEKDESNADGTETKTEDEDGAQNAPEEAIPVADEGGKKSGDSETGECARTAPETGEREPCDSTKENVASEDESKPVENEEGETVEGSQAGESVNEKDEADGVAEGGESAKEDAKDGGAVEAVDSGELETEGNENANASTSNDNPEEAPANATAEAASEQIAEQSESGVDDTKVSEVVEVAESGEPITEDAPRDSNPEPSSNVNENQELIPTDTDRGNEGESGEERQGSGNPESEQSEAVTGGGDVPAAAEENPDTMNNVVVSELDSLKAENETMRKRVKEVEEEIDRIREGRKEGMKIQADYLSRELSQQQDTEKYLREKLAEVLQGKEESERRVKDLQLRLKRFAKDDQAKDARMAKTEKELRDITHEIQILENLLDEETLRRVQDQRASGKMNGPSGDGAESSALHRMDKREPPPPQSKTCVIL